MRPARRFAFRLALALGHANPDAMLACMPFRIYREWHDYYQVEPFGEKRADFRSAIVAATVANAMGRAKGKPAFRLDQFIPKFGPKQAVKKKTPDQLFDKLKILNRLFGGTFVDKRKRHNGSDD